MATWSVTKIMTSTTIPIQELPMSPVRKSGMTRIISLANVLPASQCVCWRMARKSPARLCLHKMTGNGLLRMYRSIAETMTGKRSRSSILSLKMPSRTMVRRSPAIRSPIILRPSLLKAPRSGMTIIMRRECVLKASRSVSKPTARKWIPER